MFRCKECNSDNVQVMTWVYPNDIKGEEIYVDQDHQVGYCLECDDDQDILFNEEK